MCNSALFLAILFALGCGGGQNSHRSFRTEAGSCEVTCDHYERCKGTPDSTREQICLSECRNIFTEDGHVDRDSLLELQQLTCSQLLAFIEGSNARPLE